MGDDRESKAPTPNERPADKPSEEPDDRHEKRPEGPYKDPADEGDQAKLK